MLKVPMLFTKVNNYVGGISWTCAASEFFQTKKDSAIEWLGNETMMRVKRWLDKYIRILAAEIDNARILEERE